MPRWESDGLRYLNLSKTNTTTDFYHLPLAQFDWVKANCNC